MPDPSIWPMMDRSAPSDARELSTRLFIETQSAEIDAQKGGPPQRETFRHVAETVKERFFSDQPKREEGE